MEIKTEFRSAREVRAFLKRHGFTKVSVRLRHNPFGGRDLFFVELTDIPKETTLVHSSGSNVPTKTYGDNAQVVVGIAKLREILKETNAKADH